jgi:hypothetical protein
VARVFDISPAPNCTFGNRRGTTSNIELLMDYWF